MTSHGDENRFILGRAAEMTLEVVGNGAAAMSEVGDAIASLKSAREKMEGSRVHALQELGALNRVIDLVEPIAQGTQNTSLLSALQLLKQTRQLVQDYANSMTHRTSNLTRTITQLQGHVEATLDKSGLSLKIAAMDMRDYMS